MDNSEESIRNLMEKPIYIAKVFIDGIGRTKDEFAKDISTQFFNIKTFGDYFVTAQEVQNTFNELNVTKGVRVTLDVGDVEDQLFVHVHLTEKSRWSGRISNFVGNDPNAKVGLGGGLMASGLFPNVFGRAEKISCCWRQEISNAHKELVFQKPFGPNYASTVGGKMFHYAGGMALSGYKEKHNGVSVDLMVPHGNLMHNVSWLGVWRELSALSDKSSFAVRSQAGHNLKSSIKYSLAYDDRDSYILPTQGSLFRLSQEIAGLGGDTQFYSKQLTLQTNKRLLGDGRMVLQLAASAGHLQPINILKSKFAKPLSVMDKFFLGGPTTFRGFQNKGIGPRQRDDALGSDIYWQASANLRLAIPGLHGGILDRFRPQFFVNCGNCFDWDSESSTLQSLQRHKETMRLSYGAGIVTTFIGAKLEVNYCIPILHQPGDKIQHGFQVGVSVGD